MTTDIRELEAVLQHLLAARSRLEHIWDGEAVEPWKRSFAAIGKATSTAALLTTQAILTVLGDGDALPPEEPAHE